MWFSVTGSGKHNRDVKHTEETLLCLLTQMLPRIQLLHTVQSEQPDVPIKVFLFQPDVEYLIDGRKVNMI